MDILKLKDLHQSFMDRRLPFTDSVYPLLHFDPVTGIKSFVNITKQALNYFEENYVICKAQEIHITGGKYTFVDNFEDYRTGVFTDEKSIELVPLVVHSLGVGRFTKTAAWYEYRMPTLYSYDGEYTAYYFAKFPIYVDYTADGMDFSDDAAIYGITQEKLGFWYNQFDLVMLRAIRSRTRMVQLPTSFDFLNIDDEIQFLEEQVEKDKNTAADIYDNWR